MEHLFNIKNETDRINALYDVFDEGSRLSTKATQIEFLTTVREIEIHLKPGMRILDLGAGTGEYSLYFANRGYDVMAVELVEKHVNQIRSKVTENMNIKVCQGNALDLSMFDSKTFDVVLCFGPLYHLEDIDDRMKSIEEVKRVCKVNGKMFFAFIANDMIIATETMCYNPNFLKGDSYNHHTFKVENFPFVFHTLDDCRKLLKDSNLEIKEEIATDGLSELLAEKINKMDDESYDQWLKYHFYCSKKPEFLGVSNHLLFATERI